MPAILIPNPARHTGAAEGDQRSTEFHSFPAVNTLFAAIARHRDAGTVDWSHLKVSLGGGMAVQPATADLWRKRTGCAICEGYGLSETSPSAACNPTDSTEYTGTIGMPLPSTDIKDRRRPGRREMPARRARRARHQGPAGNGRLLEPAGGDGGGDDRRTGSFGPATSASWTSAAISPSSTARRT